VENIGKKYGFIENKTAGRKNTGFSDKIVHVWSPISDTIKLKSRHSPQKQIVMSNF
jgi:hypothetical protein